MSDIFKKFKKSIDKGVATVSIKSNSMLEINKIKVHMSSLTDKIAGKKVELGETVFNMYMENNPDQDLIESICKEIVKLKEHYQEKEAEIEKIRQEEVEILGTDKREIQCVCGQVIPEGYGFCTNCGEKVGDSPHSHQPKL